MILLFRWVKLRVGEAFEGLYAPLRDAVLFAAFLIVLHLSVSNFAVVAAATTAASGVYVYLHRRQILPRGASTPGGFT
jgi:hypothetical protein